MGVVLVFFFLLFFSLQGPKMCIPLAEEFFCSDKLTMSVSRNATVWNTLWGAAAGTQVLHAIGVTQCDSSCFPSFGVPGRGGGAKWRWWLSFLNLNFQVEEAGRNRN